MLLLCCCVLLCVVVCCCLNPKPQTLNPKPETPKPPAFRLQWAFMWSIAGLRPATFTTLPSSTRDCTPRQRTRTRWHRDDNAVLMHPDPLTPWNVPRVVHHPKTPIATPVPVPASRTVSPVMLDFGWSLTFVGFGSDVNKPHCSQWKDSDSNFAMLLRPLPPTRPAFLTV